MDVLNGKIYLPSTNSSSSSSSPIENNSKLLTKYQLNKNTQKYQTEFFQNTSEYKKILDTTTTFNYRNVTPLNEYYL